MSFSDQPQNRRQMRQLEPDIVTLYYKHINGNVEPVPSKKWLDQMEDQIVTFLAKAFGTKGSDKPLKMSKSLETCLTNSGRPVKETNVCLFNIASLVNMLTKDLLSDVLPLMANLIFITKHDFSRVKTHDLRKLVERFKEMVSAPGYVAESPNARLTKLMEIVDTIRKYSEYLLRTSGYSLWDDLPVKSYVISNLLEETTYCNIS